MYCNCAECYSYLVRCCRMMVFTVHVQNVRVWVGLTVLSVRMYSKCADCYTLVGCDSAVR
jgi:hypothetical protein